VGEVLDLVRTLSRLGCDRAYFKILGPNNNSKQQIYLAGDLRELSWMPHGPLAQSLGSSRRSGPSDLIIHSPLNLLWLTADGPKRAPYAQLVAYPQYPEVRLSGLLRGSEGAPRELLQIDRRGKEAGRILLLAPRRSGDVIAVLVGPETGVAAHVRGLSSQTEDLIGCWIFGDRSGARTLDSLLADLAGVVAQGWIQGERMRPDGTLVPCNAPNAGGYTLEARLGTPSNADPGGDVEGVGELKQIRRSATKVTLMDVPPLSGAYCDLNGIEFFKRFGRETKSGQRMDFTFARSRGHRFEYHRGCPDCGLSDAFQLWSGPDLVGEWPLAHIADHWSRKHSRTVVVRSEMARDRSGLQHFRFLPVVSVHEGARLGRLVNATQAGRLGVDPGCRVERRPNGDWGRVKTRFGFRIHPRHLPELYERTDTVDLSARRVQ